MLWMILFVILWPLLLVIPGVINAIAYSMTPYIIGENSHLAGRKALKLHAHHGMLKNGPFRLWPELPGLGHINGHDFWHSGPVHGSLYEHELCGILR